MQMSDCLHDEALDLLRRDARLGKAGAALAYERALRRKEKDEIYLKGREARKEKKRRATTSRYILDAAPDSGSIALPHAVWEDHNTNQACACGGCSAYARDLLQALVTNG